MGGGADSCSAPAGGPSDRIFMVHCCRPLYFGRRRDRATFSGAKTSSSNSRSSYLKQLTANMNVNVQQPLLRKRRPHVNRIPLMSAQSNFKVSEFQLRTQLS